MFYSARRMLAEYIAYFNATPCGVRVFGRQAVKAIG